MSCDSCRAGEMALSLHAYDRVRLSTLQRLLQRRLSLITNGHVSFELLLANFDLEQDTGLTRLGALVSCSHLQYSARRMRVNGPDSGLARGPKFVARQMTRAVSLA